VKFKIDENLPVELARELRLPGHDADTVADEGLIGACDAVVVEAAFREGRILMTLDKGIASPIQHPVHTHAGVVLFRPG
jgi:predicted nuclease of predicted toxin-antitoxin system